MLDLVLDLIPPSYSQGDPCARCAADDHHPTQFLSDLYLVDGLR